MIRAKSRRWPHGVAVQHIVIRLLLAGGLAAAGMLVTQMWMESSSRAAGPVATIDVLVTARPVEAGSVIGAGDLRWQRWPAGLVGSDWLVPPAGPGRLVGRVVPAPLAAGVPVTAAMTLARGAGSSFAAVIGPGLRAITLAVTPAGGLAGFVEPGDRVDVLLTQVIGNRRTAQTLIADLGVLGVDQRRRGGGSTPVDAASDVIAEAAADSEAALPGLVTLEVTPRQAEALAVAGEMGKLSLVLRGPGREPHSAGGRRWDNDVTGLSVAQLAAGAGELPVAVAAPQPVPAAADGGVEIVYGVAAPQSATVAK